MSSCRRANFVASVLLAALALGPLEGRTQSNEVFGRETAVVTPPQRLSLSDEQAKQIQGIYVLSAIDQDDVVKVTERYQRTQVVPRGVVPAGNIFAAIIGAAIGDAIVNNQIKERVERAALSFPVILDAAKDFDFRREFWKRLAAKLDRELRFDIAGTRVYAGPRGHFEAPDAVRGIPVDAVLELNTEYYLGTDLRVMVVVMRAVVHSPDFSKVHHAAIYAYDTPPVSEEGFEAAAKAWAENDGAKYRGALLEGAEQVIAMLVGDLLAEERFPKEGVDLTTGDLGRSGISRTIGKIVHTRGNRHIARVPNGNLISVAKGPLFSLPTEADDEPADEPVRPRRTGVTIDDLHDLLPPTK